MNNLNIMSIVAIVGCITGCLSLFMNFYKMLSEKGKFTIKTLNIRNSKFYLQGI